MPSRAGRWALLGIIIITCAFVAEAGAKWLLRVASIVVTDQDTLEDMRQNDYEFYGTESEELLPDTPPPNDDSENLSSTEDEASVMQVVNLMSGSGASSSVTPADDDEGTISREFSKGCGCEEGCYDRFSVSEIFDFKLSVRELSKNERDMFIMGKLQVLIRDSTIVRHARAVKKTANDS